MSLSAAPDPLAVKKGRERKGGGRRKGRERERWGRVRGREERVREGRGKEGKGYGRVLR